MSTVQTLTYTDYQPELEALIREYYRDCPQAIRARVSVVHCYHIQIEGDYQGALPDVLLNCEYDMLNNSPEGVEIDIAYGPVDTELGDFIDLQEADK